jgi:hypothetical protein
MRPALTLTGGIDRTPWFVFDFETQSKADLKKVGGRRYAEDPSTRLLSVAFCVCTPDNPRPDVALSFSAAWPLDLREGEFIACAHNDTGFDRHIWERLGWPRAKRRADTANMARRSGHPDASLDYLMKRYLGREKDGEGNKLVKKLSRVSRAKATFGQLPYVHRDVLERIGAYNVSDTEGLRDLLPFLLEFDDLGEAENALLARDVEIMDRGVCFDSDLAEALIEADAAYAARVREQFQRPVADACVHVHSDGRVCGLTWEDHGSSFGEGTALAFEPHDFVECTEGRGVDASELRSRDQFLDLLRECGVDVKNAQKKTLEKLLGSEATPEHAKELIRARQAGASIAASKLRAGLARVSRDGRLRDLTMYYGAHAQPLSEPVRTPEGWARMGDLRPGDVVSGRSGPARVLAVHPQGARPVFRVTFSDGAWTRCDADHLWQVETIDGATRVLRTTDLGELARRGSKRGRYRIPLTVPDFAEPATELPLDPYTLGALLGDGCLVGKCTRFTSQDPEIVAEFRVPEGVSISRRRVPGKRAYHYRFAGGRGRERRNPLRVALEALGLWGRDSFSKFVPAVYLKSDPTSRLALLQGLLDTDGSARSAGVAKYSTCSAALRDAALEIVQSLGGTARVRSAPLNGGEIFSVECRLPPSVSPFRLARKRERFASRVPRAPNRVIVSVVPDGRELCACIEVDALDRLYLTRSYIVTHNTGRWAGRGMQVQNLTKGKELPEIAAIRKADALARGVPPAKGKVPWAVQDFLTEKRIREIKARPVGASLDLDNTHFATLTRAVLCAAAGNLLVVADFAGVEARWLAWAAKDLPALAVFEDPKGDPYRELASKLFRCTPEAVTDKQRQLGKIAILALGYGMGAKKFTKTLLDEGIDLAELKREFDLTPKKIVAVWRHEHAATVQHWADLERAAYEAVEGWSSKVGPYEWARVGEDVWCMLPSGRPLVYQNMSVVMWVRRGNWLSAQAPDGTWVSFELEPDDPRQGGPGLVYRSRKGWQSVYGGLFAENVTQAGCRDLLAHAILLISRDGIPIVMHVHDENVCEVPERFARDTLHRLEDYMSHKHAPEWARGMPLKAEGFITRRYRK